MTWDLPSPFQFLMSTFKMRGSANWGNWDKQWKKDGSTGALVIGIVSFVGRSVGGLSCHWYFHVMNAATSYFPSSFLFSSMIETACFGSANLVGCYSLCTSSGWDMSTSDYAPSCLVRRIVRPRLEWGRTGKAGSVVAERATHARYWMEGPATTR